jgi:regulator of protease activity HflC (stomatin/prohibitin superfamily)
VSQFESLWILGAAVILAFFVSSAIQVADQWSKAVVLRLGKFRSLEGPGLFMIIPLIDNIPYWNRYPRSHEFLQSGKDFNQRHGAGGR